MPVRGPATRVRGSVQGWWGTGRDKPVNSMPLLALVQKSPPPEMPRPGGPGRMPLTASAFLVLYLCSATVWVGAGLKQPGLFRLVVWVLAAGFAFLAVRQARWVLLLRAQDRAAAAKVKVTT